MATPKTRTVTLKLDDVMALQRAGKYDQAEAIYRAILKSKPDNRKVRNLLGSVLIDKGNFDAAREHFEQAIADSPDWAEAHHNLGVVLRLLGDMPASCRHLEEALRLKPHYAEAWHNYVASRRFEADDPMADQVECLLARDGLSDVDRCFAHFAASKIYDDMGDADRAFPHLLEANRLKGIAYDAEADDEYFARLREVFDSDLFARFSGHGHDSEAPVFVVGMPRSGTTLAEQILASHPDVYGAGELNDMGAIAKAMPDYTPGKPDSPDCLRTIDVDIPAKFAASYLKRVGVKAGQATRLVDKNPHNFKMLGQIAVMFPKARIVHCVRSPLDTCLSCFAQNFTSGQEFSFDLADIARFYRHYRDLMAHWRTVLPVPAFELRYEDVVRDRERVTRELLAYCGLPWDAQCERFFETSRPVRTASSWQVRQPIYTTSVERWRPYEAHLRPLIEALGPLAHTW